MGDVVFSPFGDADFIFTILFKSKLKKKQYFVSQMMFIKTDSGQSSSNKCKNYVLTIYSQHINFLNTI